MMPIVLGDLRSLPPELRHYAPLVAACPVNYNGESVSISL
jgi:hypothetical protein